MSRFLAPVVAGLLGLAGSLGATLFLHRAAAGSLDRVLEERLRGAGGTAARMLARVESTPETPELLHAIMVENGLEGAYLLSPSLVVVADATGPAGSRADLLRVDRARVERAFRGEATVAFAYAIGDVPVATGYFPVAARAPGGAARSVLALEAGASFADAYAGLRTALWVGVGLSLLGALTLACVTLMWSRGERQREDAATRAARGEVLSRMAAMIAHEVRNPIGTIRAAAELVRERSGAVIGERDRAALADILGEVERLKRLTQDFLDLAREPGLSMTSLDLAIVAQDVARTVARAHTSVAVQVDVPSLPVRGDSTRLHQVLTNLVLNAAQAGARNVRLSASHESGFARLEVSDDGQGVPAGLRARLFEPFATGRADGTGLGLAISRRIVERHGGALTLISDHRPGAAFLLRIPLAAP